MDIKKITIIIFVLVYFNTYSQAKNDTSVIKKYLCNINFLNVDDAIPYIVQDKWGWLDRKTFQPFTQPIFDYTDFHRNKTLFFVYNSKRYEYETMCEKISEAGILQLGSPDTDQPEFKSDISGFIINKYGNIVAHSDKFKSVEIISINEKKSINKVGIATDKLNKKGIINSDGSILKNFEFKYSDISSFLGQGDKTFFITKELGDKEYKILDRDGNVIPIKGIIDYRLFSVTESYKGNMFFIGFPNYFIIKLSSNVENILDKNTFNLIFPKNYKEILTISGTTNDNDKWGNWNNEGIKEYFFLVSDGKNIFYVDTQGKEYKVKKKGKLKSCCQQCLVVKAAD